MKQNSRQEVEVVDNGIHEAILNGLAATVRQASDQYQVEIIPHSAWPYRYRLSVRHEHLTGHLNIHIDQGSVVVNDRTCFELANPNVETLIINHIRAVFGKKLVCW